ncbi:MAG: hypothetical protein Q8Q51_03095 [Lutibacter sp.]|nr:hypothetical protein [Lutibacter sp.]
MDSQTSKAALVKMNLNINNEKFIEKITDFIKKEKVDFWNELTSTEQKEIEKGIKELDKGKRVSYNEFLKKIS